MKTIDELTRDIEQWGKDKGILPHPDALAQWNKTYEEAQELRDAIITDDREEAIDAIGDIFVTLVMQTGAWDVSMRECIESAYNVISKRTGKMQNGQFVKDA